MLKASGIKKIFIKNNKEVSILRDCSFVITQGTTCSLIGASGSGKSTLMHVLAGFDEPTSGTITFNNQIVHKLEPCARAKSLVFVPQRPFFIKELTVYENIALACQIVGMPEEKIKHNTLYFLTAFGLLHHKDSYVGELSGGQQQRVALARALAVEPDCLLADEPTGSLDDATGMQLIEVLLACVKKWGMTFILSTHNEAIAYKMEVVFLLKDGIIEPVMNNVQVKGLLHEYSTQ